MPFLYQKKNVTLLYDSVSVDVHLNVPLVIRFGTYFNGVTLASSTDLVQRLSVTHMSNSHQTTFSLECKRMHPCFIITRETVEGQ
jgi:hypothetical protein